MTGRRISKSHPLVASLLNLLSPDGLPEADGVAANDVFDFVALMFRPEAPAGCATGFRDRRGRFRFICRTVERHLPEPEFSIERLASLVHMSHRQLQRDFCDHGTSFTRFLADRRVKLAGIHLRRAAQASERPAIAELAFRVGFNDLSHFNRVVRGHYGMSPREAELAAGS